MIATLTPVAAPMLSKRLRSEGLAVAVENGSMVQSFQTLLDPNAEYAAAAEFSTPVNCSGVRPR